MPQEQSLGHFYQKRMNRDKYHIAYFCPSKSWGGLEMNQLHNAKWMHDRGHKVLIFAQEDSRAHKEANQLNLPVVFVSAHRKYYDFVNAFRLYKKIKKHHVTHLIVRNPKDMSLCALAKSFCLNKIFLAYFMEMQIGISKRDFLHTIRFKKFDLWSCPLEYLKKQVIEMTRFPQSRIVVIPSGIERERFNNIDVEKAKAKLKLKKNIQYIGLIGRLDPQKGQHLLLEAFNKIKNDMDWHLVFLGESTQGEHSGYLKNLKHFTKENNIEDRVHFRPFRDDTENFYSAIDLFVMATKSETFGMVTIEALASGCKIVGSNSGGTAEILNKADVGLLFDSENKDDLADKILMSINQSNFDQSKAVNAANRFDFQKICVQVEAALRGE